MLVGIEIDFCSSAMYIGSNLIYAAWRSREEVEEVEEKDDSWMKLGVGELCEGGSLGI